MGSTSSRLSAAVRASRGPIRAPSGTICASSGTICHSYARVQRSTSVRKSPTTCPVRSLYMLSRPITVEGICTGRTRPVMAIPLQRLPWPLLATLLTMIFASDSRMMEDTEGEVPMTMTMAIIMTDEGPGTSRPPTGTAIRHQDTGRTNN